MANTPIKTGDKKTDKILNGITRQISGLQKEVRMTNGSLKDTDVTEGEFVFSTVQKDSQAPGTPTVDASDIILSTAVKRRSKRPPGLKYLSRRATITLILF